MHDFVVPFKHKLTSHCRNVDSGYTLTGYCYDVELCKGYSNPIFFRIGYNDNTIGDVKHEHEILSQLQEYDFVPKIISLLNMENDVALHFQSEQAHIENYCILFTECIDGISLDTLERTDPRWKIGIMGVLDILHLLYFDKEFLHHDLHPNNIMIDKNNKVYLIDFEYSSLGRKGTNNKLWSWITDLDVFASSIDGNDDFIDKLEIFSKELFSLPPDSSTDPNLVRLYMNKFIEIVS